MTETALRKQKNALLKRKYGITITEYDAVLVAQGGVCAVCQGPQQEKRFFCVDHDHKTGEPRGLLCHQCNMMLGNARDSIRILARGIEYLEEWS